MDEAQQKINTALRWAIGNLATSALLMIVIALGGYQLKASQDSAIELSAHSEALKRIDGKILDLSIKMDDKYNGLKGDMNDHYSQVDHRDDAISSSLTTMASAIASQAIELAKIEGAGIDFGRGHTEITLPLAPGSPPSAEPPPPIPLPIIGPLISSIRTATVRKRRHAGPGRSSR